MKNSNKVIVLVITTYEISLGVFMNDDGGFCHPEDMETRVLCFKHAKTFNERNSINVEKMFSKTT